MQLASPLVIVLILYVASDCLRGTLIGVRHFSPAQSPPRSRSLDSGQHPPRYVLIV